MKKTLLLTLLALLSLSAMGQDYKRIEKHEIFSDDNRSAFGTKINVYALLETDVPSGEKSGRIIFIGTFSNGDAIQLGWKPPYEGSISYEELAKGLNCVSELEAASPTQDDKLSLAFEFGSESIRIRLAQEKKEKSAVVTIINNGLTMSERTIRPSRSEDFYKALLNAKDLIERFINQP